MKPAAYPLTKLALFRCLPPHIKLHNTNTSLLYCWCLTEIVPEASTVHIIPLAVLIHADTVLPSCRGCRWLPGPPGGHLAVFQQLLALREGEATLAGTES